MSTSTLDAAAVDVSFENRRLLVSLRDGRIISVPLSWFPRLDGSDSRALGDWRLIGNGEGIHWNELDEDLSVASLLRVA